MTCQKCGGSGWIKPYSHVSAGVCFRCGGSGKDPGGTYGEVHEKIEPLKPWSYKPLTLRGRPWRVYRDSEDKAGRFWLVPKGLWTDRPVHAIRMRVGGGQVKLGGMDGLGGLLQHLWPDVYEKADEGNSKALKELERRFYALTADLEHELTEKLK